MNDVVAPIGSGRTNSSSGSVVDALTTIDSSLLLFSPAHECLVVVDATAAKQFLQEANQMQSLAGKLSQAREQVLALEDKLADLQLERFPAINEVEGLKRSIEQAQKRYEAAYAEVKAELGDKGYLASSGDGKELLELIPLAQRKGGGKPKEWGRKWTYVRSDRVKDHVRSYKLSKADSGAGQAKSFVRNGKIDTKALREQFSKVEPKLKAEWVLGHEAGFLFPNLQAWADTLNVKADETKPVQFSASVHLFRYFAGCGAGGEWNPRGGKLAGKLNAKAELMLAYGECKVEGFSPSSQGWTLALTGKKSGKEFHIGAIRLAGSAKLTGSAGASAAVELSMEVDYSGAMKSPGVKGARRPKNTPPAPSKARMSDLGAGVNAGGDVFAGVKVGGELLGSLQYLSPEKGQKFADIAAIGPKLDVMFGAGAAAAATLDFRGGKFRMKVKAGLCFGPGAKGEISLEVDVKQIANFLQWLFHALLNAGFELLEIVTAEAYDAAVRLQVLLVNGAREAYEQLNAEWREFQQGIEREDRRVALMERVLTNPPILRHCTPEAHGILLFELSRHGKLTKTTHLADNSENWEVLGRRKRAIVQVCRWAQCKSQFENMVQHMAPSGAKGSFRDNYRHLLEFMEIGPGDSQFDDTLVGIYTRLPIDPPRGFAVAQNHTPTFTAQAMMGGSPVYLAQMQGVMPESVRALA